MLFLDKPFESSVCCSSSAGAKPPGQWTRMSKSKWGTVLEMWVRRVNTAVTEICLMLFYTHSDPKTMYRTAQLISCKRKTPLLAPPWNGMNNSITTTVFTLEQTNWPLYHNKAWLCYQLTGVSLVVQFSKSDTVISHYCVHDDSAFQSRNFG